ncbi:hypothetical protein [Streptomyces sp. NPDC094468]|uniref:hypothetical protein n=1 Tax=Streptomyces sp. NPDC094468 TaxID=3366066 RepID=UPI0037FAF83A
MTLMTRRVRADLGTTVEGECAGGALVGASGFLAGLESVEGNGEFVQVLQYRDDLAEGEADLSGEIYPSAASTAAPVLGLRA